MPAKEQRSLSQFSPSAPGASRVHRVDPDDGSAIVSAVRDTLAV